MIVCRVSRKVGLLKRRVRRQLLRGEIKNCTPLWRKAHLEVKMLKNWRCRSTFWSSDVEKLHAAVAKSTFGCENVEKLTVSEHFLKFWCRKIECRCGEKHIWMWKCWKTVVFGALFEVLCWKLHAAVAKSTFGSEKVKKLTVSEHFLKFWCRKIACRCGEKHIWKWKCWKTDGVGELFEVLMSQHCMLLWRKAHLEVKTLKNCSPRSTFWSCDVEKLHAAVARSTFASENVQNTCVLAHFLNFRCRKIKSVS